MLRSLVGSEMCIRDREHIWRAFAWDEIQQRYQRSVLGLAWIVISYLFFVGAISLFFSGFSKMGAEKFTAYVAIGYPAFLFLIGNMIDGAVVFHSNATWIKSTPLPYSIYVFKSIARSLFPFAIHLVTAFVIMVIAGWTPTWTALLSLPAIFIFLIGAIAVQYLFGLIAARFRDAEHLISTVQRILFFTTPILWVREERGGMVAAFADLNPFTHFINVFRAPLLGDMPRPESWAVVIVTTILFWIFAIFAAARMRHRLPFWV